MVCHYCEKALSTGLFALERYITVQYTRAPLVALVSLCSYISLTPPASSPNQEERERYDPTSPPVWERGRINFNMLPTVIQLMAHSLNLAEILSIMRSALSSGPQETGSCATVMIANIRITTTFVIGLLMVVAGTGIRWETYRRLGRNFTFALAIRRDHKLVTDGIYSIVRHPSYSGGYMFYMGIYLCQFSPGSYWAEVMMGEAKVLGCLFSALFSVLVIVGCLGLFVRIDCEDRALRMEFKEEWDNWASKTRYKLVYYIY